MATGSGKRSSLNFRSLTDSFANHPVSRWRTSHGMRRSRVFDGHGDGGVVELAYPEVKRVGGVDEEPVAAAAQVEGNLLVRGGRGVGERLLQPQLLTRASPVERAVPFPEPVDALVVAQVEGGEGLRSLAGPAGRDAGRVRVAVQKEPALLVRVPLALAAPHGLDVHGFGGPHDPAGKVVDDEPQR